MIPNILSGKTVIVTGGSGGLGKAIATASLDAGANVVICDINKTRLDQCIAEHADNDRYLGIQADVTNEEDAERLFSETIAKFGAVDALVNNAGIMDSFTAVANVDMEKFHRVMESNLTGPVILSKVAVKHFLAKDEPSPGKGGDGPARGNIVNIGSQSSFRGGTAGVAYTASKHALKGVTVSTAAAYASKGIRCNMIMPGAMETNIAECFNSDPNIDQEGLAMVEKTRVVHQQYADVGNMGTNTVYLMSDYAGGINGACIPADGGWAAF